MLFKNYLITALRALWKNKTYSAINVLGLTLGIAVSLLILVFVLHEHSYDRFHEDHERIYRLARTSNAGAGEEVAYNNWLPLALATTLENEFTGVESAVRLAQRSRTNVSRPTAADSTFGFIERLVMTDPSFFEVFSFELMRGDPGTALSEPLSIVLTEEMAVKYFGQEDPMGRELVLNNEHTVTVTGIVKRAPSNSSITYDFLLSMSSWTNLLSFGDPPDLNWNSFASSIYVKLEPGADMEEILEQLPEYVLERSRLAQMQEIRVDRAEPIAATYLYSIVPDNWFGPTGNPQYLNLFIAAALFILLIASLNYMNLATARSLRRAKEVGVRKSAGTSRGQLAGQFYLEAAVLVLASLPLAVGAVYLVLPYFSNLIQYQLDMRVLGLAELLAATGGLAAMLCLISGAYPALVLSRFNPAEVLKGRIRGVAGGGDRLFRNGLIVFQFGISIILIVGAFGIQEQLRYFRTSSFLSDSEEIMTLSLFRFPSGQTQSLKAELQRLPQVRSASLSFHVPFREAAVIGSRSDDYAHYYVDQDFADTYGLQFLAGRDFSEEFIESDQGSSLLVNETAVREAGWEEPIGQQVELNNRMYTVVGVTEDFHYRSLREKIKPLYLELRPDAARAWVSLAVRPGDMQQTLKQVAAIWHGFTDRAMEYSFMEESYMALYEPEQRLGDLFRYFTLLAIVIAVLGIYGLAGYLAEQRSCEMGIRKVFGASLYHLLDLLTRDFAVLIGLSVLVAVPLAYIGLQEWLQDFVYRIDLTPWLFLLAGSIPLVIGLTVALLQSFRSARLNPVETLREQ